MHDLRQDDVKLHSQRMDIYKHLPGMAVAVNCILISFEEGKLRVLLSRELKDSQWLLPEGFVGIQESAEVAALRILEHCAGSGSNVKLEQLHIFSDVNSKVDYQSVSIGYVGLLRCHTQKFAGHLELRWFSLAELPKLTIRNSLMIDSARNHLRYRAARQPFGRELLPDRFTIPQLRDLYESIYERELDQRNFAKKVLSLGILIKLEERDMLSSKKGAYYFMFNPHTYLRRFPASLFHLPD